MNDQKPITTGIAQVKPVEVVMPVKPNFFSKISEKIPQKVKDVLIRFYANKKIFWPITIAFGLVFLIIVVGLLFGSKAPMPVNLPRVTPTPFIAPTPTPASGDALTIIEAKLKELDVQIQSLDLAQNKLKPPVINYKVSF